jgi:hypothetical protein
MSFLRDVAANTTVVFSIAGAVVIGSAGTGLDYARAQLEFTSL